MRSSKLAVAALLVGALLTPSCAFADNSGSASAAPTRVSTVSGGATAPSNYQVELAAYRVAVGQWQSANSAAIVNYKASLTVYRDAVANYNVSLRQIELNFGGTIASITATYRAAISSASSVATKVVALGSRYTGIAEAATVRASAIAALVTPPTRPTPPTPVPKPVAPVLPTTVPSSATSPTLTAYQSALAAYKVALAQWREGSNAQRVTYLGELKVYSETVTAYHEGVLKINATYTAAITAASSAYRSATSGKSGAAGRRVAMAGKAKADAAASSARAVVVNTLPTIPTRPTAPKLPSRPVAPVRP